MDDFRSEAIWARAEGAVPTHGGAPLIRTARIETVVLEMPSSNGPCGVATGLLVAETRPARSGQPR